MNVLYNVTVHQVGHLPRAISWNVHMERKNKMDDEIRTDPNARR